MVNAEIGLNSNGCSREGVVRGRGCQDDKVYIARIKFSAFKCLKCSRRPEVGCQFSLTGNMTLTNASAFVNPLVAGIDDVREIIVGQNGVGQITAAP